jgi:hypothetical protein
VLAGGQESKLFQWNLDDGKSIRTLDPPAPPDAKKAGK